MKRVEQLLQKHDYRQALVRLWVLGSEGPRLNDWERNRGNDRIFAARISQFRTELEHPESISAQRIEAAPLALIRALDEHVAGGDVGTYNRASRGGRETLARQENGMGYWLVPVVLATRRLAKLNKQVGNLGAWFHRHVVLPCTSAHGLRVTFSLSQSAVDDALARLWEQEHPAIKVWIGHFNDVAEVKWAHNQIGNLRMTRVEPQEVRNASLLATLKTAADAGAHIVVFPEFTLDLDQRRFLIKHLRDNSIPSLVLLVAGSFHEPVGDKVFNTAPLYSAAGRTVFTHRKLRLYGDLNKGAEDVSVGDSIHILATPVGCLTVLICKDFMDAHATVESLLTEVPVDWALVPSFGDESTIRAHKARAKALAVVRVGTHTVVAQTLNTAVKPVQPPMECVRGFGHAAGRTEPEPQVSENGGLVSFVLAQQLPPVLPKHQRPGLTRIK